MVKKVFVKTYGCQMNEADSERAVALIADEYESTKDVNDADLILINTCSVREKPEQKLLSELGRLKSLKKKNPNLQIGVMGCVAQQRKEELIDRAPWVDVVLGPDGIDDLPELLKKARVDGHATSVRLRRSPRSLHVPANVCKRSPSAYVNVMKGCDKFCTYCIVPFTRGREASRDPNVIIEEIRHLTAQGVKEITLLGQNVTAFGRDLQEDIDLASFIRRIIDSVDGIERIRFLTSHPNDTDESLLDLFAHPKVCPFLHLPLQAGSNKVLQDMGRGYTVEEYVRKIEYVRSIRKDIAIASDFIVGFPTETREDFDRTLDVVRSLEYDVIYSFAYSPRPFTKAASFEDNTTRAEKLEWLAELQAMQAEISHRKLENLVGTVQKVLIEGKSARSDKEVSGRTPCNKPVNIPLPETYIGSIIPIRITEAMKNSLRGELAE